MPAGGRLEWDEGALADLFESADGPVARMLNSKGERVAQEAKRLAPVSPHGSHGRPSGWLRSHIGFELGHDSEGLYADIKSEAYTPDGFDYGLAQEVGNARTPAQPYLRPALDAVQDG